jgi:hypothetical protein
MSIFKKPAGADTDADADDSELRLVRVAGLYTGVITGGKLRIKFSMSAGAPVGMRVFDLPRGRIKDFSIYPSVTLLMANGDVLDLNGGRWRKAFSATDEEHDS